MVCPVGSSCPTQGTATGPPALTTPTKAGSSSASSFGPPRRRNSKAPKAQSNDECADILGIPAATVKTGMFYARKKLAELVAWSAGLPE